MTFDTILLLLLFVILVKAIWVMYDKLVKNATQDNAQTGKPQDCTCIWLRNAYTTEYELTLVDVHCTHHGGK